MEEYARGTRRERAYEVALKPVQEFTPEDRAALLASAFQMNRDNLLNRYPRFRELWESRSRGPCDIGKLA